MNMDNLIQEIPETGLNKIKEENQEDQEYDSKLGSSFLSIVQSVNAKKRGAASNKESSDSLSES